MATQHDYNHIHPKSEESYGHMHSKGGDHHVTANHQRGSAPGRNGHEGSEKM
jgi:hypothetical protein